MGSRAQGRGATESAVPVDVLSATDLVSQGAGDLKDQLRTIIPSFSTNSQPISGVSTVVRPTMLRNLAPDHTLVLINGKRRHRSSIADWHGGNGVAFGSQAQGFMGGSNAVFSYSPPQAGTWSRHNVAAYGDVEVTDPGGAWTLGAAVRIEDFEDFGTTTNGKVSGRVGLVRGSVSTGFRAPTPGQQHGIHIQSWLDPTVGDLVNNAVIPSISPVALLRGGAPLEPEKSLNTTAGVVFGGGPFTLTADYFRIDVSDRLAKPPAGDWRQ